MDTEPQLIISIKSEYHSVSCEFHCLYVWAVHKSVINSAPHRPLSLLKNTLSSKSFLSVVQTLCWQLALALREASQRPPSLMAPYTWSGTPLPPSVNGLLTGDAVKGDLGASAPPSEIHTGAQHPAAASHTPGNVHPALSQTLSSWEAEFLDTISRKFYFKTSVGFLKLFFHRKFAWFSVNSTSDLTWFSFFCDF